MLNSFLTLKLLLFALNPLLSPYSFRFLLFQTPRLQAPPSSLAKIFKGKGCSAATEAGTMPGTQKVLHKCQLIGTESKTPCLPCRGHFSSRSEMMAVCLFTHSINIYSPPMGNQDHFWGLGLQGQMRSQGSVLVEMTPL